MSRFNKSTARATRSQIDRTARRASATFASSELLAESLRTTTSRQQLLELVATRIQSALQASNVAVLLHDEASGDYPYAYFCVYSFHNRSATPYPRDGGLARDSAIIRRMVESGKLIDLDGRDDLQSEEGSSNELSSEDHEALRGHV